MAGSKFNCYFERSDAARLKDEFPRLGLSRSAMLTKAIEDIDMERLSKGPRIQTKLRERGPLLRIDFGLPEHAIERIDEVTALGHQVSQVLRDAMRVYLDMEPADLQNYPGFSRAPKRAQKRLEALSVANAIRKRFDDGLPSEGAKARAEAVLSRARQEASGQARVQDASRCVTAAPPTPIRNPGMDWSKVTSVEDRKKSRIENALARLRELKDE